MPNWKKVIVSGSDASLNSLNVINGITGSLLGTGSWANRAISASIADNAVTASRALNANTASYVQLAASSSYALSASNAFTSSYAFSASYAMFAATASSADTFTVRNNAVVTGSFTVVTGSSIELQVTNVGVKIGNLGTDTHTITGSLNVSSSTIAASLRGSGSSVFSIDGTAGRLFQVDDSLTGSLFSVNTAAGLPIIEAFSDNTVRIGQFGQRALFVSQSKVGIGKESLLNGILDVSGSVTITGSLLVSGSITGSLFGTASWANNAVTASYILNAVSSSFATTSSFAFNAANATTASYILNAASASYALSASYAQTSSFVTPLRQNVVITGSLALSGSASIGPFAIFPNPNTLGFNENNTLPGTANQTAYHFASGVNNKNTIFSVAKTGVNTVYFGNDGFNFYLANERNTTGSFIFKKNLSFGGDLILSGSNIMILDNTTGNLWVSGSVSGSSFTGSLLGTATTASFVLQAVSASFATQAANASSASFATSAANATTASYANFANTASSADNFNVRNTLTATTIVVQTITSSQEFVTGSTRFGSIITNTHQFTGSVSITGSLTVIDGVTNNLTASWANRAISASIADNAVTASRALNANTASYIQNAASASYALTASFAINAGALNGTGSTVFATTGSNTFIGNQTVTGSLFTTGSNTLIGSTTLTGSLNITGSTTQVGNNNLLGTTTLSGSILMSGSISASANILLGGHLRLDPSQDPGNANVTASYLFTSASNTQTGFDLYYRQNENLVKFKWIEGMLNTGVLYGGVLSYSGSFFYLTSGSGIIVSHNAVTSSEINPIITYVTWNATTQSILDTGSQNTYVYIDATGSLKQQTSFFTPEQYHELIPIGRVSHYGANSSVVTGVGNNMVTAYDQSSQLGEFVRAFGPLKVNGLTITPQGGTMRLNIGSGTSYNLGGFYQYSPDLPSIYNSSTYLTSSIIRIYRSGSGFNFDNNGGSYYTAVDPTQWDNGSGTLQTVGNSNWSIQRVFVNPVSGRSHVYYGQTTYATYLDAIGAVSTDDFIESDVTKNAYVFAGYLVMEGGAGNTNLAVSGSTNAIIQAGLFRNSVGGSGGAGAAVINLDDLADVNITSPSNGQALVYSSGLWINSTPLNATTASYVLNAVSASYALSASYATASAFANNATSASYALTASYATASSVAISASFATTSSFAFNASTAASASFATNASTATSASFATNAANATSASYAAFANTASSADNFNVRNTLTATTLVVQTITSSVSFITGSTKFGTLITNTHQFTGSVLVTGSITVIDGITNNLTASWANRAISASIADNAVTASRALNANTASFANFAISASYALTSSNAVSASNATTASYVLNAISSSFTTTSSFAFNAANATSASFVTTASYVLNAVSASFASTASFVNTLNQPVIISGSLTVVTGSNIELQVTNTGVNIGNSITDVHNVTGSFNISGSLAISSSLLTYRQNPSVVTGSFQTIASIPTGSYRCAFFDYVTFSGSVSRAGTVYTIWSGSATEFTETYTQDLGGSTAIVTLQTAISGSNIELQAGISGSAWTVRSLVRLL